MQAFPLSRTILPNGFEVAVCQSDSPGVAVNLWYEVGSVDEDPQRTGFAHLFEHLMFQGSANVASGEHMSSIESVGGTVNATTSADRTNYFETVPRGALELALWMEADRLASLDISEQNFAAQREVVKEEKRERYDNQPYGDLLQLIIEQHFPIEHPYGHLPIGSMADLDSASIEDVTGFFTDWYRPSNARLVLCGPISPDEGFGLVDKYFAALPNLPKPKREFPEVSTLPPSQRSVNRQVPYSVSYLTWQCPPAAHPDQPALDLALSILADGHASRLHRSLVKDGRHAQESHATFLSNRLAPSIAMVMARPVDGTNPATTADAVRKEISKFIAEGPTEDEVRRAIAQYERSWLWQLATAEERADLFNESWLLFGDPTKVNTHLDEVLALTPEDVHAAANRWLQPENAHELLYRAEGN